MYFLQKEGVYPQGIYWIGSTLIVGKKQADLAASKDVDSYHSWNIYKWEKPENYHDSPPHELMYTTTKGKA